MDRILIAGLREMGVHGVLPEEHHRAQPFQVDLELLVDLARPVRAMRWPTRSTTARSATRSRAVVADEHYELLERLAARIAEVCRADERVQGVVVELRKLEPPIAGQLDHVGVRIER